MTKTIFEPTLLCDFYKVSHMAQYPEGTESIYSTWIPRSNKYFPNADKVVAFGVQGFIKKYLINYFDEHFFNRQIEDVVAGYKRVLKHTMGIENPEAAHIEDLHKLGYLPIRIKAVKEGSLIPIKVPILTIENTQKKFFWITNYLETLISNQIWLPMTSATIAYTYRQILNKYSIETTGNIDGVQFQAHDFSMRGMGAFEASVNSGAGHLLSFVGTDTIPSISYHEEYYNADIEKELVGTSIPATEHSVMCAYGDENEFGLFKRLINVIYPNGLFSVVSDTWDFWKVVGEYLPALKDDIMAREGKVVIRPDSGDPILILCGDIDGETELERKGLIEVLWNIFGGTVTDQGYKLLDTHIGAIYGDSITLERCEEICRRLKEKGFASTNVVFGVGSFTYQYNTRDTFGFAMKATHAVVNGQERFLFKDPKTDDGTKKSLKGRAAVYEYQGEIIYEDGHTIESLEMRNFNDMLETVFEDGELLRDQTLQEIRTILNSK